MNRSISIQFIIDVCAEARLVDREMKKEVECGGMREIR